MSTPEKGYNINQTFIIDTTEGDSVLSACTAFYTTNIYSCTGNTEILLGLSSINMVGDIFVSGDLSANTVSATTYYGDGSNLTGISTQDTFVTGGTYSDGTAVFTNNTGGTFNVSGFYTGATDVFVTGATYNNDNQITFINNTGGTFSVLFDALTGLTVNGNLNTNTISATTYQNLPVIFDRFITGFTYDNNTFTIIDNSGVTYNTTINSVTGLTVNGDLNITGTTSSNLFSGVTFSGGTYYGDGSNLSGINDYFTTGATFDAITKIGTFTRNDGNTYTLNLSSLTTVDTYVTGFTSSGTNLTILQNEGQPPISTTIPTVSLSGALSSVTFNIVTTGNIQSNGLTASTISATTYQNLPVIPTRFVTGFTYSPNTFTISDNSGSTFNATINTMTGLTINGGLTVSGNSQLNGGISSTSFTGSTDRIVQVDSGGTFSAVTDVISAYISSGSTAAVLLSNVSNWDINGNYIGIPISGTFQGQKWYDNNYFYEAVQDNLFIRLIRG
jgi:hypothetical protein